MTLTFLPPPPQWGMLSAQEKIERVREQVVIKGLSYSAAAEALGTTRHGIAGTINRAALTDNPIRTSSGLKNQKGAPGGKRDAQTKAAKKARARAKPKHAGFHKFVALNGNVQFWVELSDGREVFQCLSPVAIPEGFVDRSAVSSGAWEALAGSTPVALADLPNGACKWAIGDRPMLFCAEPVDGDKPYCSIHAALAYREPPPRKDNGRRDSA